MTKLTIILLLIGSGWLLQCKTSRKATNPVAPTVFFDAQVITLIQGKCAPCHIPSRGGKITPLVAYDQVAIAIDNIIDRVNKQPGDIGFMPFKHNKLSPEEIAVFTKWKAEGMARTQ